ncbi:hypothetical protein B9T31_16970 [Acinetobacter sp. ANC 4558]|uniref:hypothetical protein n=1 Tax=Acinetobacter sp. ANC 4558 TaxID=1977876 RepID=UPI000A35694F|nr:hypothetical protein [Acinetobacter sp. ANC 4558]OTG79581.1 hypothetical protein B9T31_16970 [Acinetobacter sp. ANC 4558]
MDFLKKAELTSQIFQELENCIVPSNWGKVVFYAERFQDEDIGLVRHATVRCWITPDLTLFNRIPVLDNIFKLNKSVDKLYELSRNTNEQWCGLGVKLTKDGKYTTRFYYKGNPLVGNDHIETDIRINEINM